MTVIPAVPSTSLKAVLFDRDDTIAYTDREVYREAAIWTAGRFGLEPRRVGEVLAGLWAERGQEWWHIRTPREEQVFWDAYGLELMSRLGLPADAAPELMHAFPYERYMKAVPNAREVLLALRERGLKIGVLSNTLPSIDRTLEAVGLADLVDVAVASCTLGVHKPDADAFLQAAALLGLPPAEILFVDDKPENVQAALALGMQAMLIDLKGVTHGAIHDLSEVVRWVDS